MTAPAVTSAEVAEHAIVLPGTGAVAAGRGRPGTRRRSLHLSRVAAFVLPRWPLFVVLAVISVLAGHLMMSNTAFVDEANQVTAGHIEWQHWLHGGPTVNYATYFSGAPVIFPPLAAVVDTLGGLALVRTMNLVFMLVATVLMYATTRRLFSARAAGWAVAVFATVNGAQFIAAYATYDAMAYMFMAFAVWVAVRFAQSDRVYPHAGFLLGVPILALANATKYASGLFDPVVVVLVGLVIAQRYGRRQGVRSAALFAAMLAAVLCAALAIAGHNYQLGIMGSTVARHGSGATTLQVLGQSVHWIGLLAALSLATAMACLVAWRRCRRDPGHESALGSSPLLVLVLAGAVVLAPLEQAHLHTTVSLHKHVAYGGWYASIAVGVLLSSISGSALRSWWRWAPVLAGVVGLLFIGRGQAQNSFGAWPNTTQLLASMQPYVAATANKPVLMDDSDVALYYLGAGYPIWHWSNTYYVQYQPPGATAPLLGEPALRSAIRDNHFGVVALDQRDPNTWMDQVAKQEIAKNPQYHYLGRVPVHDRDGADWYELWINRASESAR